VQQRLRRRPPRGARAAAPAARAEVAPSSSFPPRRPVPARRLLNEPYPWQHPGQRPGRPLCTPRLRAAGRSAPRRRRRTCCRGSARHPPSPRFLGRPVGQHRGHPEFRAAPAAAARVCARARRQRRPPSPAEPAAAPPPPSTGAAVVRRRVSRPSFRNSQPLYRSLAVCPDPCNLNLPSGYRLGYWSVPAPYQQGDQTGTAWVLVIVHVRPTIGASSPQR
jgi:hypothetical protein